MDETPVPPTDSESSEGDRKLSDQRRLDKLLKAKKQTDEDIKRWSEIESEGRPIQSADRPAPSDPPRPALPRSTPKPNLPTAAEIDAARQTSAEETGQEEGLPETETSLVASPPAPVIPKEAPPPPPFLHPTDKPLPSAPSPAKPVSPDPDLVPSTAETPAAEEDIYQTPVPQTTPPQPQDQRSVSAGMSLPRPVPREDVNATIVSPSSYRDAVQSPSGDETVPHGYARPDLSGPSASETVPHVPRSGRAGQVEQAGYTPSVPPAPPPRPPAAQYSPSYVPHAQTEALQQPAAKRRPRTRRRPVFSWGCLLRTIGLVMIGVLAAAVLGAGGAAIYYSQVTAPAFAGINSVEDLQARALQFETTRIRDREGNILYQINDPQGGLRDYVPLEDISPWLIHATLSTEEREYFTNPGFSIPAIVRAVYQNYREGRAVSGASTITQQLTRALLLPEEERNERTYTRKIKEIFLAAELARRFSKEDILELYLNQIYYGNLAYGSEAAAQTYFGKSAKDVNIIEAAMLAGIPQAPAVWDPVTDREAVLDQRLTQQVLPLMLEAGCIDTGISILVLPCVDSATLQAAQPELTDVLNREYFAPNIQAKYPHWVVYIQQQLEADEAIGPSVYTSGYDVYTTLDPRIQEVAQAQVETVLAGLTDRNVNNASVVVVDVNTGAILAMVGSRNFNDDSIDGQVNVALTPQQPGSSIKPFTYLAAFQQGWTPASVIWDVPVEYEMIQGYAPVNYDETFRGPVSVRSALANSLNVPAVLTLDAVTVPGLVEVLNDVGIYTLGDIAKPETMPASTNLSLTLGAGDVYLIDWVNAYATIANGGKYRPVYGVERIEIDGQPLEGYPYQVPEGEQVFDPSHVYMLQSILTDKQARIPSFGQNTPISPPYPAGAKTGTTNNFVDNWTMGFTTEVAVGVWVGNSDNTPMINVTGVTGAGPIWRGVMDTTAQFYPPGEFLVPSGFEVRSICWDDGAEPSDYCKEHSTTREDIFPIDITPVPPDQGLYQNIRIDTFTGLRANEFCNDYAEEEFFLAIPNPSRFIDVPDFAREWLLNTPEGQAWLTQRGIPPDSFRLDPPDAACDENTPRPEIAITFPEPNSAQEERFIVLGTANAPGFSHYIVDFGLGPDPQGWGEIQGRTSVPVSEGALAQADFSRFAGETITLRLVVFDQSGNSAETRVTFQVEAPTATPTPRPTTTLAPTPGTSNTPSATSTSPPTVSPAPTEAPTADEGG